MSACKVLVGSWSGLVGIGRDLMLDFRFGFGLIGASPARRPGIGFWQMLHGSPVLLLFEGGIAKGLAMPYRGCMAPLMLPLKEPLESIRGARNDCVFF